jgi:hypothetical protein
VTDIEALVVEWRDARAQFIAVSHSNVSNFDERKPIFDRLANAEDALMKRAKEIQP